jgi:hypothetical protein
MTNLINELMLQLGIINQFDKDDHKRLQLRKMKDKPTFKLIRVGDFTISKDGVIYNDLRDDVEEHIPVCSPLFIKAITRNKDGNDWGKLLVLVDPEGKE